MLYLKCVEFEKFARASGWIRFLIPFIGVYGRTISVAIILMMVANCTNKDTSKFSPSVYGVPGSPRVVQFGEQVPKGGGTYMVGNPYKIAGKWYYPKHDPNYVEVGNSSWYGPTFHGRLTANGEVYDMKGLTAAHATMPLPSYARVTNLSNGTSIVLRVNDRGPFHSSRIIDVSEKAAEMLEFKSIGTARVRVEYLGKASMDGLDYQQLHASYRPYGSPSSRKTQIAYLNIEPPRKPGSSGRVIGTLVSSASSSTVGLSPKARPTDSFENRKLNINTRQIPLPPTRPNSPS